VPSAVAWWKGDRFTKHTNDNCRFNALMCYRSNELPPDSWGPEDFELERGKRTNRTSQVFENADPTFATEALSECVTPRVNLARGRIVGIEDFDDLQRLVDEVATATNELPSGRTRCGALAYALHGV